MSNDPAELLRKALELPAAKRLDLARDLLESVEGPDDPEWAAAWLSELDRRTAAFNRGEVELDDWDAVEQRLLAELKNS